MRKVTLTSAAIFLLTLKAVSAEPGPTVRTLIESSVSAFSFGLYRMEQFVRTQHKIIVANIPVAASSVFYDWKRNKIKILFISNVADNDFEIGCKHVIEQIRNSALAVKKTGIVNHSLLGDLFISVDIGSRRAVDDKIAAEIDGLIEMEFRSNSRHCAGSLLGDGYDLRKH
jgi:hypothetical protein